MLCCLQEIQQQLQELQQTTEDSSELQEEVQRLQQQNQVLDRYICSIFGKPARKVQAVFGGAQVLVVSFLWSFGVFAVETVFKNRIVVWCNMLLAPACSISHISS